MNDLANKIPWKRAAGTRKHVADWLGKAERGEIELDELRRRVFVSLVNLEKLFPKSSTVQEMREKYNRLIGQTTS